MAKKVKPVRVQRTAYSTKNQQDTTLRNNRATRKREQALSMRLGAIEQRQMRIERRLGLRNPSLQEGDFNKRLADLELLWDLLGAEVFRLLKHTGLVRQLKRELRALLVAQQERLHPEPWRGRAYGSKKLVK